MKSAADLGASNIAFFAIIIFVGLGLGWIVFSRRFFPRMERANYTVLVIAFYLSIWFVSCLTHS